MSDHPLSVPKVSPRPGGHLFCWESEGLTLALERIREHHDTVSAEIWATQEQDPQHLIGGVRFSLTTPTGRSSMVKALTARRNGVDWGAAIEQVSIYALARFREQEPLTQVGEGESPPLRFCLRPVLPENQVTLLYGYGGSYKTTLAYVWGLLVLLGEPRLGLEPAQGPVLLLDWETDAPTATRILKQLHAGMDLPGKPLFHYRRLRRPLTECAEEVKAEREATGSILTIYDSFGKACGSEKVAKEEAIPTMNAIGWIGGTALAISHRAKPQKGEHNRSAYGSVYVENDVRQSFLVETPAEDTGEVAMYHAKHNLMKRLQPFGYKLTFDDMWGISVVQQDVGEMAVEGLYAVSRIQSALHGGPLTVDEIIAETGLPQGTIRSTLSRHRKRFVNLGGRPAKWGLCAPQETPGEFR